MRDMNNINFSDLQQLISSAGPILLTTHINPDCDGLGSEIALYHHLRSIGKECRIINTSGMRDMYNFLDLEGHTEKYSPDMDDWIKSADITILLDIWRCQPHWKYEINCIRKYEDYMYRSSSSQER